MRTERIGFALCGSFCTHEKALKALEKLTQEYETVIPITSENAAFTDTRFGTSETLLEKMEELTGHEVLYDIPAVEPLGPQGVVGRACDCTGHREYTGEIGERYYRYGSDNGGEVRSAVRKAGGDSIFHQ